MRKKEHVTYINIDILVNAFEAEKKRHTRKIKHMFSIGIQTPEN